MRKILAAMLAIGLLFLGTQALAQKTITAKLHSDVKHMDPHWTTANITNTFGYMVYDVLFSQDAKGRLVPQMVGSYDVSPDKMTYKFTLRDGLLWSDGSAVRAQDAVASIQRWAKADGAGAKLMDHVTSLKAANDKTFEMKLKDAYPLVLRTLGKIYSIVPFIIPEKATMRPAAGGAIEEIVGSGPFTFSLDESRQGSLEVFYKSKTYKPRDEPASYYAGGKHVYVDKVVWKVIPDYATAIAAIKAGEVDFVESPPIDLWPVLRADSNIEVKPHGVVQLQIHPNHLQPPFNDVKVRQVLMAMVNQSDYMLAVAGNDTANWRECYAYLGCELPTEDDTGMELLKSKDMAKAKQMLKDSSYDGSPITIMVPTTIPHIYAGSLYTVQMLKKVGFNVIEQTMDWGTLTSRRPVKAHPKDDPGGWNIFHTTSGSTALPDPWGHNNISTACDKAWYGWPCSPRANAALLRLGDLVAGSPEYKKELSEYHAALAENIPYVPLGEFFQVSAIRTDRISGVLDTPYALFWNIKKK